MTAIELRVCGPLTRACDMITRSRVHATLGWDPMVANMARGEKKYKTSRTVALPIARGA